MKEKMTMEFWCVDDQGKDYTIYEYTEYETTISHVAEDEYPNLSRYETSDGVPCNRIDESTFAILFADGEKKVKVKFEIHDDRLAWKVEEDMNKPQRHGAVVKDAHFSADDYNRLVKMPLGWPTGKNALYHVGDNGCGKIAIYTTRRLIPMVDLLSADNVILLNGEHPVDNITPMVCGSCGEPINGGNLEYKDAIHRARMMKIEIFAIEISSGERKKIDDLVWFEEHLVSWFEDPVYEFEIYVDGIKVFETHNAEEE